jgi:hypothetical protein
MYVQRGSTIRSIFLTNPDQAYFDENKDWKLRHQADPEFDIHNNFDDLMSVYFWVLATGFMLRGSNEVRLPAQVICFLQVDVY